MRRRRLRRAPASTLEPETGRLLFCSGDRQPAPLLIAGRRRFRLPIAVSGQWTKDALYNTNTILHSLLILKDHYIQTVQGECLALRNRGDLVAAACGGCAGAHSRPPPLPPSQLVADPLPHRLNMCSHICSHVLGWRSRRSRRRHIRTYTQSIAT